MRFSYTEANLLPENHQINIDYNKFLELFGEEGNLIILATEDPSIFTPKKFNAWNNLSKKLDSFVEVDFTVAIGDIQKLTKNKTEQKFDLEPLYEKDPETTAEVLEIKNELFERESAGKKINYHVDDQQRVWLNLDYTSHSPGGPFMHPEVLGILE